MANIDSGLGWSCNEDYYVNTSQVLITYPDSSNTTVSKTNNGGAIVFGLIDSSTQNTTLYLMSTVIVNASISASNGNIRILNNYSQYVESGFTWYISLMYYQDSYYNKDPQYVSQYPTFTTHIDDFNTFISSVLQSANITYDNQIPTTDYVKSFVGDVFKENNKRMATPSIIGAPLFSSSSSYSINDYVIKEGNLYKCISAHSGDWNPSNFTQTSILSIILNQ